MDLDYLIEYESENTTLDFKTEEYGKNKIELIKDIMAMANANTNDKKYIIIGVKDSPNEERKIIGIENISDQANLENVIQENIEPAIHFKYYKYSHKGKMLGIIEIDSSTNRPYMMKKDNYPFTRGDAWIRKGSRQSRVVREDIDSMIQERMNYVDSEKVKIGIDNTLEKEKNICFPIIDYDKKPSNIEKRRLEGLLEKLRENRGIKFGVSSLLSSTSLFPEYLPSSEEIKVGSTFMGQPVYCGEEEILKRIKNVSSEFSDEDYYFFLEENSLKLNFSMYNDTNMFLEDVKAEFKIAKNVFLVSEHIPIKPVYDPFGTKIPSFKEGYPKVQKEEDYYIVTEYLENVRHKELTKVFSEELRCCKIKDINDKKISIPYKISAKNLATPIEGKVVLNWE